MKAFPVSPASSPRAKVREKGMKSSETMDKQMVLSSMTLPKRLMLKSTRVLSCISQILRRTSARPVRSPSMSQIDTSMRIGIMPNSFKLKTCPLCLAPLTVGLRILRATSPNVVVVQLEAGAPSLRRVRVVLLLDSITRWLRAANVSLSGCDA